MSTGCKQVPPKEHPSNVFKKCSSKGLKTILINTFLKLEESMLYKRSNTFQAFSRRKVLQI
eukprot:UN11382